MKKNDRIVLWMVNDIDKEDMEEHPGPIQWGHSAWGVASVLYGLGIGDTR